MGRRLVLVLQGDLREALQSFQLVPVLRNSLPANRRQFYIGIGFLVYKSLLDLNQTALFQFCQVAGQVTLGQSCPALEKDEIRGFH